MAIDCRSARWELIVVDNASTDDTLQVAHELAARRPGHVRVVEERELGLSSARNAGVRSADGDIVAFIDDDALPDPGWADAIAGAFRDPLVMAAGGPVRPVFEGALPDWFGDRYLPYLTEWDRGAEPRELSYNDYPRGANLAVRRTEFERVGMFSRHLGRKGRSLLSCEEIELCLRIERFGGRIVYVPGAGVRHLTATERITPRWLMRRFAAQGRSEAIIHWQHAGWRGSIRGLRRFARPALRATGRVAREPGGFILACCQWRALGGALRGSLEAPLRVPRFQPRGLGGDVAAWMPPA